MNFLQFLKKGPVQVLQRHAAIREACQQASEDYIRIWEGFNQASLIQLGYSTEVITPELASALYEALTEIEKRWENLPSSSYSTVGLCAVTFAHMPDHLRHLSSGAMQVLFHYMRLDPTFPVKGYDYNRPKYEGEQGQARWNLLLALIQATDAIRKLPDTQDS